MAVGLVDRKKLVNIADAVRSKTGITGKMTLDAIASNITSMPISDNNAKFDFSVSKSNESLLSYLTTVDLSNFDTSNYGNMENMFNGCSSLTSLDLSKFNTMDVNSMSNMFKGCSSLKSLDLSSFDTSNVITIDGMFNSCFSLTTLDLSNFKTSNVITMEGMFADCSSLTSLDLSSFDTSEVIIMEGMFNFCEELTNLTLGFDWAINSSISSFDLSSCPLTHISALNVINNLATRDNSPVITFSKRVALYKSEIDVATNKGWSVSGCHVLG